MELHDLATDVKLFLGGCLVFRSTDVTHGLKIAEMNIKSEIKKGKDTEIMLTPSEVGHFVGKCAHFCGKGHGSMTLQIEVVE